jgi:DNA polymerase-4
MRLKPRDFPGIGRNMEERFHRRGVRTFEQMWNLTEPQMREIWGGIVGTRFYHWLRGEEVSLPPTRQRSIGHQHVLEPEFRTRDGALLILQKLLAKAAVRMRKHRLFTQRLSIHVRFMNPGGSWEGAVRLEETRDTWVLMQAARDLWKSLPEGRPLRVGAVLSDLVPESRHQLSFFESERRDSVIRTVDSINTRFGRDTVYFGGAYVPPTRISFQRVPDLDEF